MSGRRFFKGISMKASNFVFFVLVSIAVCSGFCWAYPKPAIAPALNHWNIDVEFSKPQQILVDIPTDGQNAPPRRFWYVILTLTNNSAVDAPFFPSCDLMTDTFKIVPAGTDVMGIVFKQIKLTQQGRYPFLESLEQVDDRILQGADNARDIAIIWPDFDGEAKNIDLFIGGLSNEVVMINHPIKKDKAGNPEKVYLRKTLQLKYAIGGDKKFRSDSRLEYKTRQWVMR